MTRSTTVAVSFVTLVGQLLRPIYLLVRCLKLDTQVCEKYKIADKIASVNQADNSIITFSLKTALISVMHESM